MCRRPLTFALMACVAALAALGYPWSSNAQSPGANPPSPAPRGFPGDLWADVEVGKRDFTEITPREVVPYKVSAPGGVIVDRSVQPGRAYVWDSGNSRILGLDLARCYAQASPCSADIVIGQPSAYDYGACNLDSSFQFYPERAPASAATLCGVWEGTHTTLEDKSFANMEVDGAGNLYVPDSRNNRVLKYVSPFTTDVVADEVWGQADFTGNACNASASSASSPTASTLCFHSIGASGSGVTLDAAGNVWVADGGNNRVLRFPKQLDGTISKTADIVLGQPDFTTGGDWSFSDAMDRMHAPAAVRFDAAGNLYVADSGNQRVLVFRPPLVSGMNASSTLGSGFSGGPLGLELDPLGRGMWTFDNEGWDGEVQLWGFDGILLAALPLLGNPGGGSIGIDAAGAILPSTYVYGQDVYRHTPQPGGTYAQDKALFSPPFGYNLTTSRRLEHPGWVGVAVAADQLVVADGRLLFWNNPLSLVNGQPADGYLGAASFTELPDPGFGQVKSGLDDRVWVTKRTEVRIYQAPLSIGAAPLKVLQSPLPALGGGQIDFDDVHGLAPTPHSEFLWLSEPSRHRVFRVRDPLSDNPLVDVVLGQTTLDGDQCNRGLVPAPNQNPGRPPAEDAALDMLCFPGALALDRSGNLYVSDHFLEAEGNWRLLMFSSSQFPASPASILFAPAATKEFPRSSSSNPTPHMTFEPAFDSTNRMVVGLNPYSGRRFVDYYGNPTTLNPADPRDPAFAQPDGQLKDFYGWAVAATFDSFDNLYVLDANRGKVLIYYRPFTVGAGADLEVSGISFTSPPTVGVQTTAVARLANVGRAPSGGFNVKWFLDDVEVGYGGHVSLAPGEVSNGNIRFVWTPTPGAHTLRFDADADNHVAESNEQNNSATVGARLEADLEVSGISFTSPPTVGVQTTAVARLANVGRAPSGGFNVKWFLDGVQVGYGGHVSLAPGEVSDGNVRFDWIPTEGAHTLRFDADVDNQVAESNEQNNSATVGARLEADLEVSGISFTSPPTVGVQTTAVARLANVGRAPSGGFNVKWFLDGVQLGYGRHASLGPGQVSNDNIRFNWTPTTPGRHVLRFRADVDNQVAELNEQNNNAAVTVRLEPDLEVSGIDFTSPPVVGSRTTAVARLANIGNAPSGGFNVKWFLDGVQVGYGRHASLGPGQVSTGNIRFNWTPTTTGRHVLRFDADVDNHVDETNEGNNRRAIDVNVAASVKVVVKSFIAPIGSNVGSIRIKPPLTPGFDPLSVAFRLKVFAALTEKAFPENPGDDGKDKGYRLYTERTFTVTCRDSQLINVLASRLDTDAGKEGRFQPPALITSNVSTTRNGLKDFQFTWSAKGRPDDFPELAFQAVYPRDSVYIWHTISGRIHCVGSDFRVAIALKDSRFPSDRVFVNNKIVWNSRQGPFSDLWVAHPSDNTLVR